MSEPIRVAQVMGYMNGGGVEQVVMNYYRYIDRARVQFDFIVCDGSKRIPEDEVLTLGGHIYQVPSYSDVLGFHRVLVNLFQKGYWHIVHSHMNALSVFPLHAAMCAGIPVRIAHSHSTAGRGEPVKNVVKTVLRCLSNVYPTYRMACSRHAGEWLFGRRAEFELVPNAIELEKFAFNQGAREALRAELNIASTAFVVGHIGRFMEQKNHHFLIEVFSGLIDRHPESVLVLIGDGPLRGEIENRARELGIFDSVRFLGQRDDVAALYSTFDVFCLPSLYEGLGMVAIEAQASGLRVIASTNVPQEADVTGSVRFLPLGSRVSWEKALAEGAADGRLEVNRCDFDSYDIRTAAIALGEKYQRLATEIA